MYISHYNDDDDEKKLSAVMGEFVDAEKHYIRQGVPDMIVLQVT